MSQTRRYEWVPVALILFAVLLGSRGPVTRVRGGTHYHWGLNQFLLASEPVSDCDAPLPFPTDVPVSVPVVVGTVLLILKARRSGYGPLTVRRLRLPLRKSSGSLLPD